MRSLPTLDPYVFFPFFTPKMVKVKSNFNLKKMFLFYETFWVIFKLCVFFPMKGWACIGCVSGKRHEWRMLCSLPWRSNLSNALRKCPYFLQSYGIWTAFGSSFRHRRLHSKACRNCLLHPFIHFLRFTQNDDFVKIYIYLAWQQFCLIK